MRVYHESYFVEDCLSFKRRDDVLSSGVSNYFANFVQHRISYVRN